jgi:hypothetical protein
MAPIAPGLVASPQAIRASRMTQRKAIRVIAIAKKKLFLQFKEITPMVLENKH